MKKQTTANQVPSRVTWESLEAHIRLEAQKCVQRLLEEEVTEQLGRVEERCHRFNNHCPIYGQPHAVGCSRRRIVLRAELAMTQPVR
jgi:hypothetical protein